MSFKIAARTILQLGSELISSDAIAFYELIKNAFDAASPNVKISIVERIPYSRYRELREKLQSNKKINVKFIQELKEEISSAITSSAPFVDKFLKKLNLANSNDELLKALDSANYIRIQDSGEGMSLEDLQEVYLTIGTRSRYLKRKKLQEKYSLNQEKSIEDAIKPILGEKGVGRLSAMRLGNRLRVQTKRKGEKCWNYLEIDWTIFSHESDMLLQDIEVVPWQGKKKVEKDDAGTTITISGLNSKWSEQKIRDIAKEEFRKLTDPFISGPRYPIKIKYNSDEIRTPSFDKLLYDLAHARVKASFEIDKAGPHLTGDVNFLLHKRKKSFSYDYQSLKSICDLDSPDVLRSLGPFNMTLYWYNRRLIRGIDGIGTQQELRGLIAEWHGGLMLFRDKFRVKPYGGENDDWLDLDKKALGWGGFKLNRRQVIGKVEISSFRNPKLIDQTNREGLVDNDEKAAMISMLKLVLFNEFKVFTDRVDKEVKVEERLSFKTLENRLEEEENEITEKMNILIKDFSIPKNNFALKSIQDAITDIKDIMNNAKDLADIHGDDRTKYLHLAGVGLMAEILAHELNRASGNLISTLKVIPKDNLSVALENQLDTLLFQLKTLQKRLKVIDPTSTRGRQVKESFDLVVWVDDILIAHKEQFKRHGIQYEHIVKPSRNSKLEIKAVKGMIVQILENLISNSVYWLKDYKKEFEHFHPHIKVETDTELATLSFSDNGPGIQPEHKEEVFQPFFSLKPFKIGRGLGLYISKEIAEYNSAKLYLSDSSWDNSNKLSTFILEF